MFAPLLSTKLYIPRRPPGARRATLVARPHLLAKLEAGMGGRLTLISAPAGFGKSTLLTAWIEEETRRAEGDATDAPKTTSHPAFCWLSLEESDNDPIRFWLYCIAAFQTLYPGLSADTPALLQSPEPPPLETILTILLNDLNDQVDAIAAGEVVFVLEDYHLIAAPAIHQSLTFFLDHLPPTIHLVITTRADPPLPLARWRARGQLLEIRADDLRFSAAETTLFLNERMGLHLLADEVDLLKARTEGWIVGIQLAALSMHGYEDKSSFLRAFSGSHRYILNYLIEEVLNQQPHAVQEFLLRTSILARLCGPLCTALLAGDATTDYNSQAMLTQIEQANLFLIALDDKGEWYRYHQLFAEVLQHRLRQNQPGILPDLHRRASHWYAEQGYFADAIHHVLLAADFMYAAALIEQLWSTLWNQGVITTLFHWMQALPDADLSENVLPENRLWGRPSLYVSYAWGLALTGQIAAAENVLQRVEVTLPLLGTAEATAPPINLLLGRAAALRAMLAARRGEPVAAVQLAQQALTLIPPDAAPRGDACYALGLANQQQGTLAAALEAYQTATRLGAAANDSFLTIAARYHEARILMAQGDLHLAATTYQQVLTIAAQSKKQLPVVGLAHIGYGEILYQWNDLAAAARQVDIGLTLSPRRDLTYTDGPLHRFSILARIRQAGGDLTGTLAAIALANETAQQTGLTVDAERAAALAALIHLRLGKCAIAQQWAELYAHRRTDAERFTYLHEFETLVFVRVLLASGRIDEALTLLAQWLPAVESAQRQGSLIEIYLLQGLAFHLGGQTALALQTLARVLALAEPEGYVRLFVDEGEPMRLLIFNFGSFQDKHWIAEQASNPTPTVLLDYRDKLLSAFAAPTAPSVESANEITTQIQNPKPKIQNLIEPLTDREIEVLRLVTAGLSNAAIAEELVVSVGTVKTHLKHIYGKLAVESRTQAVAQAHALGLL